MKSIESGRVEYLQMHMPLLTNQMFILCDFFSHSFLVMHMCIIKHSHPRLLGCIEKGFSMADISNSILIYNHRCPMLLYFRYLLLLVASG